MSAATIIASFSSVCSSRKLAARAGLLLALRRAILAAAIEKPIPHNCRTAASSSTNEAAACALAACA